MRFEEEENPTLDISERLGANALFLTQRSAKKFDEKTNEGIFPGYSETRKAYRVYNKKTQHVEESVKVSFSEANIASS